MSEQIQRPTDAKRRPLAHGLYRCNILHNIMIGNLPPCADSERHILEYLKTEKLIGENTGPDCARYAITDLGRAELARSLRAFLGDVETRTYDPKRGRWDFNEEASHARADQLAAVPMPDSEKP